MIFFLQDLETFLNESANGVIYFCLGSLMRASTMTPKMRKAFVSAFKQVPQNVLWKWEADSLPDKPSNVLIKKWMPQRDILGMKATFLFFSLLNISEN